ncbi:phge_rel_HI1409, phage-associated protein, HI1409 family [uncultured Caudovirales phage]|uniref:Phge_rel_HI1409, phage-associated protein, HI1409 family n=1 Tax=uncultured Caudovirales phage TaxID=2100421 RepID=A0A6J5MUS1_9CAUD|nr:phge_rel_HI1409, phage-associated protein, HI1409 family [uncultured Caudovirales phage]
MAEKVVQIFPVTDEATARLQKTVDGFDNFVSRLGLNNDNSLSAGVYMFNLMTRNRIQLEAAYRGSWVVGKVIDCIAEDMTKAGLDITTNESKQDLKDLKTQISRRQVWQSLCSLIKWGRLYGGAIGVLQITGQDPSTPLDISTIAKGQFTGITVYDRWMVNPDLFRVIKNGPEMGLPAYYAIVTNPQTATEGIPTADTSGQLVIHHSRVIRNIGIELPYFQAITEMMWGESVLERLWDRLISFDSATMSSANLIERANNRTIGIEGLREIVSSGGPAQAGLEAQLEMMRAFQTNEGLTIMDKEDTFATTSYSFAGLSDIMLQFGQQLAGAANTPLIRMFGQSPAGMSATGESDIRMYYDDINAQQESRLRPAWEKLLKVLWHSTYGEKPPKDLEFEFTPLWQMSTMDKATIGKTQTETLAGAEEAGFIKRSTAMKELRQNSKEIGLFSNISDEDIKEAEEEEAMAPPEPLAEGALDPLNELQDPVKDPKEMVPILDAKPGIGQRILKALQRK